MTGAIRERDISLLRRGGCLALAALLLGCSAPEPGGHSPARAQTRNAREEILSLLREPDVWRRTAGLAELLSSLPPDALADVRDLLQEQRRDLGAVASLLLVTFWAKHEPAEASEWVIARAPASYRVGAIAASVTEWARVAPQEVVQRLGLTGGHTHEPAIMRSLVRGWFASDDPGLEPYIHDLGPGIDRQRALAILARERIARDGPDATMRWAERSASTADDHFALDLVRQVGSELTLADPQAGVAWCDAHCNGPHGDALRELVATRWAARDPDATLAWLEASTDADPKQRKQALRAAFGVWVRRDRPRALAWVESLSESQRAESWRQGAIAIYVNAIGSDKPEQAIAWTSYLKDPKERELALVSIARRWRRRDPDAAEAWLARSPLSEEARKRVRTPPKRERPRRPRAAQAQPKG